jgi:dephospho-CoA kinase
MARDRLTTAEAAQRLASQLPIEDKIGRADHVIDTSKTFEDTDRGVQAVWNALQSP